MEHKEKDYLITKKQLATILSKESTAKKQVRIEAFFHDFLPKKVKIRLEEQVCPWGTAFFSCALQNPIMPDYFLHNGSIEIADSTKNISELWNGHISPALKNLDNDDIKGITKILNPNLTLVALKSATLANARLARYFINESMLKVMNKRVPSGGVKSIEMFSSRYWQLVESVHGHLFGRKKFFSEMYSGPDAQGTLLVMITTNKALSLGYMNYSNNALYVDRSIALELGSELGLDRKTSVGKGLGYIKEMISRLCASFMADFSNKNKLTTPEYVDFSITQEAPALAMEVRNTFNFDSILEERVGKVFDMFFNHSLNVKEAMNNMSQLFDQFESSREQTFASKLKMLIASLFDLFMILPKSKTFLFCYCNGSQEDDLGITWAIVSDGPDDDRSIRQIKDHSTNLAKGILQVLLMQKAIISGNESLFKKERSVEQCNNLISTINSQKDDGDNKKDVKLPDVLKKLKEADFKLTFKADERKESETKGLYALCLTLEVCSYLTGEAHENNPLMFTFLISGSHTWHSFDGVISDGELFEPEDNRSRAWNPELTSKMIKANYSILQIPRVVAFLDRSQVWNDEGLRNGQIVRLSESEINKGLIGYPFLCNSRWRDAVSWGKDDYIVEVNGMTITVLRGDDGASKGVVPFIEWDTKKNVITDLEKNESEGIKYIEGFLEDNGSLKRLVVDVLTTISTTPGEGTLIACYSDRASSLKDCFHPMDNEGWQQLWRKKNRILRYDRDTLRAALRMDGGARMVKKKNGGGRTNFEVEVRQSVRPNRQLSHSHLVKLVGRGSRHHSGAALSLNFVPSTKDGKAKKYAEGAVIVVSADGPITKMPFNEWLGSEKKRSFKKK